MTRLSGAGRVLTALAAALLTASCGAAYRGEPVRGVFESDDPQLLLGERVFYAQCHACHPGGDGGLGFSLNDKPLPGWLIRRQVRNGFGAMPSFSSERIDDEELDALVAYLQALRAHGGG